MGALVVAGQRVEIVSGRQTWLEAIHLGNMAGKRIMPNLFFNELLLGKDTEGRFRPIPDEIQRATPLYTGTVGVVGAKGRALGTSVVSQCLYAGSMKTVIVKPDKKQAALVDTIVLCDHAFAPDGTPLLQLSNARTEKPVCSDEEMGEADEVLLRLHSQMRGFRIQSRYDCLFEAVGNENTSVWVPNSAAIGLMRRGSSYIFINEPDFFARRRDVGLDDRPSDRLGVMVEVVVAAGTLLKVTSSQPTPVRQNDTELIVRGTKAQLDALIRHLETTKY